MNGNRRPKRTVRIVLTKKWESKWERRHPAGRLAFGAENIGVTSCAKEGDLFGMNVQFQLKSLECS